MAVLFTCKSVCVSESNWVPVLTNTFLLAKTDPGALFFLFFWLSHRSTAALMSCSHSSVHTSGPFIEMWRRLSNILLERRGLSLVLILFMELAPRSGQAFVIGKLRIALANEARRGKRVPICRSFFNTASVCVSPISFSGAGMLNLAMWNLNSSNSATTSGIFSGA